MPGAAVASARPRPDRPRRRPLFVAAAVALLVLLSFTPQVRTAVRVAALLPYIFPNAPARPLDWVTTPPTHEVVQYTDGSRQLEADLYRPAGTGRHAAFLLSLGVHPAPRADPALVMLGTGVARDGFVVFIPESPDLRGDRILPSEIDAYVAAVRYLRQQPFVDAERIGFIGFSVGASLLTVTAADARVRSDVRLVNFFGGYDDATTLLREITTRRITLDDGRVVAWEPDPLARGIFAGVLLENVDDRVDRAIVSQALVDGVALGPLVIGLVGDQARLVYELFTSDDPERVDALIASFPDDLKGRLRAISPSAHVQDVEAKMFLMHDTDDHFIPFVESRRLAARLPAERRVYTEFSIFAHVEPTRSVDLPTFLGEVWKLARHLYRVMYELA